ncbi:uncharacterized protein LY89DRAFT_675235 [Mollisia scopiformis]|uniref:2EXR domain-containing protein n=1 Tax=Mollisia scopiformis TaxID=149040 RepID=A0A132BD90_MOLSC|nr:uncharacterized protein LY89DRAFT_675235 [Mollisia scopiformis]KUJ10395.1 hypothetical protein LY89DRAFT_675235 [Mollisia scopiformis]
MDPDILVAWAAAQAVRGPSTASSEGTFTLFTKLPTEMQEMIWVYAVPFPEVLEVRFKKMSCGQEGEHESNSMGIQACKHSRAVAKTMLPKTLPSATTGVEIRFDPEKTAIRITNIVGITAMFWDKFCESGQNENFGLTWLCPNSYLGQNIQRLVVHENRMWRGAPKDDCWLDSQYAWVHTFRHMFKDVEDIICLIEKDDPEYTFDKESYDGEFDTDPESCDEDEDDEEEDCDENDDNVKERGVAQVSGKETMIAETTGRHQPIQSTSNEEGGNLTQAHSNEEVEISEETASPRRWLHVESWHSDDDRVVDLDRIEKLINDFWANVIDDLRDKHNAFKEMRGIGQSLAKQSNPPAPGSAKLGLNATSEVIGAVSTLDGLVGSGVTIEVDAQESGDAEDAAEEPSYPRVVPVIFFHEGSYDDGLSLLSLPFPPVRSRCNFADLFGGHDC